MNMLMDISEVKGKVNQVQVTFLHRIAPMDFFVMEPNQSNIMLGRNFLRAMKGFIDIGNGFICLRGKAKGKYLFPRKKKNELIENQFEGFYDSDLGDP